MTDDSRQPLRTYRCSDEVYRAAQEAAARNGESVSKVIVRALAAYASAGATEGANQ